MKDLLLEIDKNSLLDGITISGGEPFIQAKNLISFIKEIKKRHLHIMIYSGYTFEEIMSLGKDERELLSLCDTLVDGRFIQSQRSLSLRYKGSLNQRIIDVSLSLQKRKIILQDVNEYGEFIINKS